MKANKRSTDEIASNAHTQIYTLKVKLIAHLHCVLLGFVVLPSSRRSDTFILDLQFAIDGILSCSGIQQHYQVWFVVQLEADTHTTSGSYL